MRPKEEILKDIEQQFEDGTPLAEAQTSAILEVILDVRDILEGNSTEEKKDKTVKESLECPECGSKNTRPASFKGQHYCRECHAHFSSV